MKVKVKDLKPNPYRNMEKYPVDREKVEALKISIEETDFWDNILARKMNGSIQIAYGHHRLIALQELRIEEVDIPIRELDDATMIKIMANENMEYWQLNPVIILETIHATCNFLDAELAKYDKWEAISNKSIRDVFKNQKSFEVAKGKIGKNTVAKFLGKNWSLKVIQDSLRALTAIKAGHLDEKAVESLPTMRHVREFIKPAQKLSKAKQRKVAKEIVEEETPSRSIPTKINETQWKPEKKDDQKEKERKEKQKTFDAFLLETNQSLLEVISRMKTIKKIKDELGNSLFVHQSLSIPLTGSMEVLNNQLTELLNN